MSGAFGSTGCPATTHFGLTLPDGSWVLNPVNDYSDPQAGTYCPGCTNWHTYPVGEPCPRSRYRGST